VLVVQKNLIHERFLRVAIAWGANHISPSESDDSLVMDAHNLGETQS
jgi:hypothetical protein